MDEASSRSKQIESEKEKKKIEERIQKIKDKDEIRQTNTSNGGIQSIGKSSGIKEIIDARKKEENNIKKQSQRGGS